MGREFCRHCGEVCNMRVTVTRRRAVDTRGRATEVPVRALHCERCGTFVRSEDVAGRDAGQGGPAESGA